MKLTNISMSDLDDSDSAFRETPGQGIALLAVMFGVWDDWLLGAFMLDERKALYAKLFGYEMKTVNTQDGRIYHSEMKVSTARSVGLLFLTIPGFAYYTKLLEYFNMPGLDYEHKTWQKLNDPIIQAKLAAAKQGIRVKSVEELKQFEEAANDVNSAGKDAADKVKSEEATTKKKAKKDEDEEPPTSVGNRDDAAGNQLRGLAPAPEDTDVAERKLYSDGGWVLADTWNTGMGSWRSQRIQGFMQLFIFVQLTFTIFVLVFFTEFMLVSVTIEELIGYTHFIRSFTLTRLISYILLVTWFISFVEKMYGHLVYFKGDKSVRTDWASQANEKQNPAESGGSAGATKPV